MVVVGNNWFSLIWQENPLKLWLQCKEAFVAPDIVSTKIEVDETCANVLDIRVSALGWKTKYDKYEFGHDPFIDISLLKRWRWRIMFKAPEFNNTNRWCYWEGMMDWLWKYDKDIVKTYNNNVWSDTEGNEENIVPYLTKRALHKLYASGTLYKKNNLK